MSFELEVLDLRVLRHELGVVSYEFRVRSCDLRFLRHELGVLSYEFRVRRCDLRVLRHELGVLSYEFRVWKFTTYEVRVINRNLRGSYGFLNYKL